MERIPCSRSSRLLAVGSLEDTTARFSSMRTWSRERSSSASLTYVIPLNPPRRLRSAGFIQPCPAFATIRRRANTPSHWRSLSFARQVKQTLSARPSRSVQRTKESGRGVGLAACSRAPAPRVVAGELEKESESRVGIVKGAQTLLGKLFLLRTERSRDMRTAAPRRAAVAPTRV